MRIGFNSISKGPRLGREARARFKKSGTLVRVELFNQPNWSGMLKNLTRSIDFAANLAIIVVACLLGTVLIKNHLLIHQPDPAGKTQTQVAVGAKLSTLDIAWEKADQTLVLALSSSCHFCSESAPFYKRLILDKGSTRIVAVLPQPVEEAKGYLQRLGVSADEIRQLPLGDIGIRGTPTLLLVDASGIVKERWVGRLPTEQEASVLSALSKGKR